MSDSRPIGIFDSGVGGTSIWKEITSLMPYESTIYLADSINAPYGSKSPEEIRALCKKNTDFLLSLGAKIIVVACNTATTNAISYLRATYQTPIIGIEPAIKPAAARSENKAIGILATKGTLNSKLFADTSERFTQDLELVEVEGKGLVPMIENGDIHSDKMRDLLRDYMQPMIAAKIDYLVLGCSHYPYLIPLLKQILPASVKIIDSGLAVARQTKAVLQTKGLRTSSTTAAAHMMYTNVEATTTLEFLVGNHMPHTHFESKSF